MLPKRKNYVFVRCFWRKICEGEYFNTSFFFTTFGKKWRIEICFVIEKSTKMRIQRREVSTIESANKEFLFLQQKEDVVFPFFQRRFLHCEKRHWKNDIKRLFSEKMLQKKRK